MGGAEEQRFFADLTKMPDDVCRNLTARLVRIAAKLGVPRDQREDIVQEALLHAFAHREQFHGHTLGELHSWLAAIIRNVVVDAFRSRGRHPAQSLEASSVDPLDEKEAKRADMAEWSECLVPLLGRLEREDPEGCRLVHARYLEGRSIHDLAEQTGRKAHAISCCIYRALQKLHLWAAESGLLDEDAS